MATRQLMRVADCRSQQEVRTSMASRLAMPSAGGAAVAACAILGSATAAALGSADLPDAPTGL